MKILPSHGNDGQYVPGMPRETLVWTPPEMLAKCFASYTNAVGPWWGVDLGQEVEVANIEIKQSCKYGYVPLRVQMYGGRIP
jgi:hypothetical protein